MGEGKKYIEWPRRVGSLRSCSWIKSATSAAMAT